MFQLIHVGFASHPRKKKKDIYELGFSRIMWEGRGGEVMLFLLL